MTVSLVLPCAARIVRAAVALASLTLLARAAHADDPPPHVHVVLHPRGTAEEPVTFVDISVQGTEAPIHLVRRIGGACSTLTAGASGTPDATAEHPAGTLVEVACETASTRFVVARERQQIVVMRGGTGPNDAPQVIARAVLPAGITDVRVDP